MTCTQQLDALYSNLEDNDLATLLARSSSRFPYHLQVLGMPSTVAPASDGMGSNKHVLFGGSNRLSEASNEDDKIGRVLEILDEALALLEGDACEQGGATESTDQ